MARKSPAAVLPVAKNLKALRGALEHSVTIQQARLQQIVDDLVVRGSLTRAEGDRLVGQLVTSSKGYSSALLAVLDSVTSETRGVIGGGLGAGVAPVVATVGKIADTVRAAPKLIARKTAAPTAPAAPTPAPTPAPTAAGPRSGAADPIPGYADLTVAEIRPRLGDLSEGDLRKVRATEQAGKGRKTLLAEIDRRLR